MYCTNGLECNVRVNSFCHINDTRMFSLPKTMYFSSITVSYCWSSEPLYWHESTLIPLWMNNNIHYKTWDEITCSRSNFNSSTHTIWESYKQFRPTFYRACDAKLIQVSERGPTANALSFSYEVLFGTNYISAFSPVCKEVFLFSKDFITPIYVIDLSLSAQIYYL